MSETIARLTNDDLVLAVFAEYNITNLVLARNPSGRSEYDRVIVAGLVAHITRETAYQAVREAQEAEKQALRGTGMPQTGRMRDETLCGMQVRMDAQGYRERELGSNIYGWAIQTVSNLDNGGTPNTTRRGLDKAAAVRAGLDWVAARPTHHCLSIAVNLLPKGFYSPPETA